MTSYHNANQPEWITQLADLIFEGLPEGRDETFHAQLREAVSGVNLESIQSKLEARRLARLIELLRQLVAQSYGHSVDACLVRVIGALDETRLCYEVGDTAGLQAAKEAAAEEAEYASHVEWAAKAASRIAAAASASSRPSWRAEEDSWVEAWEASKAAAAAKMAARAAAAESPAESAWAAALAQAESAWAGKLAVLRAWEAEAADLLAVLAEAA